MKHCLDKEVITTDLAPRALGPYSVGIRANHLIFTAGQIGINPETNELVDGGIQAQTRQALENVRAVLEAAGSSLDLVLKTTVFLKDMAEFGQMNSIYAEFFGHQPPARSAVQVAALPKDAVVEIEAIAVSPCETHDNCCHD